MRNKLTTPIEELIPPCPECGGQMLPEDDTYICRECGYEEQEDEFPI